MIREVRDGDLQRVREFLERHVETSLFLLSNLAVFGPRLGEHSHSGNYCLAEESGRVIAVFCLTRGGNLLVQAGGRTELARPILVACGNQPRAVSGVIGEWPTARAIWALLQAEPSFQPVHSAKDVLYQLALSSQAFEEKAPEESVVTPAGVSARALQPEEFPLWEPLNSAYLAELSLPLEVSDEQRKAEFTSRTRQRLWWGAFDGGRLCAIAGLNATYGTVGQVGGVYTRPEYRGRGVAAALMQHLMADSRSLHGFEKLILFTGEDNTGARRLYESLGFKLAGAFGLLLGTRAGA